MDVLERPWPTPENDPKNEELYRIAHPDRAQAEALQRIAKALERIATALEK